MKKTIAHIILLLIGIYFCNVNAQNYTEFEKELIKHHGIQDTLFGDDLWIYDKSINKIKKVEPSIYSKFGIETYLVDMTWYLGYHIEEVNCVFTFDPKIKKLEFIGELWCNGFKEDFFCNLIDYPLPNDKAVKKFVADFEQLLQLNNPKVKLEKIYLETGRTVFYQTDYIEPREIRKLWRIIVLNHPNGKLSSINVINPSSKTDAVIE